MDAALIWAALWTLTQALDTTILRQSQWEALEKNK